MKNFLKEPRTIIMLVVIFGVIALSATKNYIDNTHSPAAVLSSVVVNLVNADRSDNGIKSLSVSPILVKAAQLKADDMATKSYFGHVNPDNKSTAYWFYLAGYDFLYAGENLGVNFSESSDAQKAWMDSRSHRNNILNSAFTEIGVAVSRGVLNGKPATFVVQMFGTKSTKISALKKGGSAVFANLLGRDTSVSEDRIMTALFLYH